MPNAELPANGSIVCGHGRFFLVRIPLPPATRVHLVEMPVHNGPGSPKVLSVDPDKLRLAISRGVVTIVRLDPVVTPAPRYAPAAVAAVAVPVRPYPFERARAARQRRKPLWRRAEIAELRRRGLLMTGAEYAKRLEAMRRRALRRDEHDPED